MYLGHVDYLKHEHRDYHCVVGGGCINVARRIEDLHAHVEFETAKWWQWQGSTAISLQLGLHTWLSIHMCCLHKDHVCPRKKEPGVQAAISECVRKMR
jgi:hypothetical protein